MYQDQVSIKAKIVLGFLLGILAIGAYYGINRWQVSELSDTIVSLSSPDSKIQLLNGVFQEIIQIDQSQRREVASVEWSKKPNLMAQSLIIPNNLEQLQELFANDSIRLSQIDTLSILLQERDMIHLRFLRDKITLLKLDGSNFESLDSISSILSNQNFELQSDRISYVKKSSVSRIESSDTIRLTTPTQPKKPGFLNRIFSKNKDKVGEEELFLAQDQVVEDAYEIFVDSFVTAKKDTFLLRKIEDQLTLIREEQIRRNKTLLGKELNYVTQSNDLINYALALIQILEVETFNNSRQESASALTWASRGLTFSSILLAIFSVCALVLVTLILTDITKARKYRLQLVEEKEKVIQLTKVKEQFLANISHEIKTPLQAIIGYTDSINNSNQEIAEVDINLLKSSTEHLLFLVNDILDFSKVSSDQFKLESEHFSLNIMWEEIFAIAQLQVLRKDIQFQVFTPKEDYYVYSDKYRIKQIFLNIINNAIKFTDQGFVKVEINYNEVKNGFLDITTVISDSGPGIPLEDQNRIFQYFEQGSIHNSQVQRGGTGLGLAIVSQLLKALGGEISLNSKIGNGSEFTIKLQIPLINGELLTSSEMISKEDDVPWSLKLDSKSDLTIYVIDDDTQILNILQRYMSDWQIPILYFSEANDLVQNFSMKSNVILLTDLRLGKTSGLELISTLKNQVERDRIQYILMTAETLGEENMGNAPGIDQILYKPFKYKQLFHSITAAAKNLGCLIIESEHAPSVLTSDLDLKRQNLRDLESLLLECKSGNFSTIVHTLHQLSSRFGFDGDTSMYLALRKFEVDFRSNIDEEIILSDLIQYIEDYLNRSSKISP